MTVSELLIQVRYQINDTDSIEYTDAELIGYVNEALQWLSNELIRLGAPMMMKDAELTLTNGTADLPSDFVREAAVIAGDYILNSLPPIQEPDKYSYTIYGGKLYSDNSTVILKYYASFPLVSATTDELPVPDYMLNLLREIVIFLALNRNEYNTSVEQALIQAFGTQVFSIAMGMSSTNYEYNLPWQV